MSRVSGYEWEGAGFRKWLTSLSWLNWGTLPAVLALIPGSSFSEGHLRNKWVVFMRHAGAVFGHEVNSQKDV